MGIIKRMRCILGFYFLLIIISCEKENDAGLSFKFSEYTGVWEGQSIMIQSGGCAAKDTNWVLTKVDLQVKNDKSIMIQQIKGSQNYI